MSFANMKLYNIAVCYCVATQSVWSVDQKHHSNLGAFKKCRTSSLTTVSPNKNMHFNKIPGHSYITVKFEKHWFRMHIECPQR